MCRLVYFHYYGKFPLDFMPHAPNSVGHLCEVLRRSSCSLLEGERDEHKTRHYKPICTFVLDKLGEATTIASLIQGD